MAANRRYEPHKRTSPVLVIVTLLSFGLASFLTYKVLKRQGIIELQPETTDLSQIQEPTESPTLDEDFLETEATPEENFEQEIVIYGPPKPDNLDKVELEQFELNSSTEKIYISPVDFKYFRDDGYLVLPKERGVWLGWVSPQEDIKFDLYELIFSRYKDFRKLLGKDQFRQTNILLRRFPLGNIYWKLRGRNKDSGEWSPYSAATHLQIYTETPGIQPTQSTDGTPKHGKFHLAWAPLPRVTTYEIEYGFERDRLVQVKKTRSTRLDIWARGQKSLYWRIRSLNDLGQGMSQFSEVHEVHFFSRELASGLKKIERSDLKAPKHLYPASFSIITKSKKSPLRFTWETIPMAKYYEIQLANTPEFFFTVYKKTTKRTHLKIKPQLDLGQYFWRVRYRSKKQNEWSQWSEPMPFTLQQKTL